MHKIDTTVITVWFGITSDISTCTMKNVKNNCLVVLRTRGVFWWM